MVFDLIERLHRSHGLTSILVTHNLDLAARCTRALRLESGRLAPYGGKLMRIARSASRNSCRKRLKEKHPTGWFLSLISKQPGKETVSSSSGLKRRGWESQGSKNAEDFED